MTFYCCSSLILNKRPSSFIGNSFYFNVAHSLTLQNVSHSIKITVWIHWSHTEFVSQVWKQLLQHVEHYRNHICCLDYQLMFWLLLQSRYKIMKMSIIKPQWRPLILVLFCLTETKDLHFGRKTERGRKCFKKWLEQNIYYQESCKLFLCQSKMVLCELIKK